MMALWRSVALAGLAGLLACTPKHSSSPGPGHLPSPAPLGSPTSRGVAPLACGGETCRTDQFCEDRFKGHDVDDEGRPLDQRKCMALPDSCRATPTCACVTQHVAATHCSDHDGKVEVDDYPE